MCEPIRIPIKVQAKHISLILKQSLKVSFFVQIKLRKTRRSFLVFGPYYVWTHNERSTQVQVKHINLIVKNLPKAMLGSITPTVPTKDNFSAFKFSFFFAFLKTFFRYHEKIVRNYQMLLQLYSYETW